MIRRFPQGTTAVAAAGSRGCDDEVLSWLSMAAMMFIWSDRHRSTNCRRLAGNRLTSSTTYSTRSRSLRQAVSSRIRSWACCIALLVGGPDRAVRDDVFDALLSSGVVTALGCTSAVPWETGRRSHKEGRSL